MAVHRSASAEMDRDAAIADLRFLLGHAVAVGTSPQDSGSQLGLVREGEFSGLLGPQSFQALIELTVGKHPEHHTPRSGGEGRHSHANR